jgi:hypothetical protein
VILAWHFVRGDRTLRDGRPLVVGEWLEHTGPLVLRKSGLHACVRAMDALMYAPGPVACRVECDGETLRDADKLVCRRRRAIWAVDATDTLRVFARRCALDVIHLWDAPEVVRRYLYGDESARASAEDAASRKVIGDAAMATAAGAAWAAAAENEALTSDCERAKEVAWWAAQAMRCISHVAGDCIRDQQNSTLETLLLALAPKEPTP